MTSVFLIHSVDLVQHRDTQLLGQLGCGHGVAVFIKL